MIGGTDCEVSHGSEAAMLSLWMCDPCSSPEPKAEVLLKKGMPEQEKADVGAREGENRSRIHRQQERSAKAVGSEE